MIELNINGKVETVDLPGETPLLWALRDGLGLTGTKYGCGIGACGACTVHVDGVATPCCELPISTLVGREIVTIEGLAGEGGDLHPVQKAWIALQVPQCGYCQPAQVMAASALLAANPEPDDAAIDKAMRRVLCRCATYGRIREAVHQAAKEGAQ